jgi:hypothetical protein
MNSACATETQKTKARDRFASDDSRSHSLITNFARIAENNGDKSEAVVIWNKAIEVYPQNKTIYQAEIDRLNKL